MTDKEKRYWQIQLGMAERNLEGCKRNYELTPNPWYKTMLEFAEKRYAECKTKLEGVTA